MGAGGERQPGRHWAGVCVPAGVRSRRRAPRQPAAATRHARARSTRHPAPSAGAPAADRAAAPWQLCCRIGHDDDGRLPGGRLTRVLPPRANGHDRGAWCERRNRAASARWGPRSPGHPASRLHPRALVRAAFDNIGSDRRGLRARHADTHAQSNTRGARGLKVRRSPSIGRASRTLGPHRAPTKLHPRPKYIEPFIPGAMARRRRPWPWPCGSGVAFGDMLH